jgi:hypothetical protein
MSSTPSLAEVTPFATHKHDHISYYVRKSVKSSDVEREAEWEEEEDGEEKEEGEAEEQIGREE